MEKVFKYRIPKKINLERISDPPNAVDLSHEISKLFNFKNKRKESISEYMCKSIKKTKMRAYSKSAHVDTKLSVSGASTTEDFHAFFDTSPTSQMSRFMEKSIRKLIHAKNLEQMYPQIVEDIMKDAKLEYLDVTHYASVNLKIKDKRSKDRYQIENFKFLGKTKNYENFLVIKRQFEIRWILHHNLLKSILEKCVLGLPYELFQLKFTNVVDLVQLQTIFKEKIQFSALYLNEFYEKIITQLESEETCNISRNYSSKYLGACSGLLSVHISRSLTHTIQSIVTFTENRNLPPYLKLYVDFEEGLVLKPTSEDIVKNFYKFLSDLIDAGGQLRVLERRRVKGFENKTIFLCLTQEFIQESKDSIKRNIENLYKPIAEYLEKLSSDFAEIYSDINSEDFFNSISDIKFEEGFQKIDYYKKYIHKVAYIPDNEYFEIGQLVLTNYREKLHDSLQVITDSIFNKMCNQHLWEVTDVCDSFQLIQTKAIQKPHTTEELIEIGKFMSWVKNEHLAELQERVCESISSICNIITLGPLTDDHMKINSKAIKWLDDILPLVEQHSANFEQLKFEAEEKLQKVIEDINVMIHDVYPLLVILDEMDDIKRAKKYLADISLHMTKIKEIQVQIEWVNKEEVCLSFPKSTYAEFEQLKEYVYPFYHLLKLCLDVQRHVAVWEFGQFDLLDFESTQKAVDYYGQELADIYRIYRKKLRQAQDDNLPLRFRGTVDDPDILNWPAPLKLCATTTKILDEFKPSLKLMKIMCNDALCARHWKAMSDIAGINLTPDAGTTLKKIMEIDLKADIHEYEIISVGATKENQLLNNLVELEEQWKNIKFTVSKNQDGIFYLTQLGDIESVVDDHIIKVLNMRGSVFVQAYEKKVMRFYNLILNIQNVIFDWAALQEQWIKLLPILSIENLQNLIPIAKGKFEEIDQILTKNINNIAQNPIVIQVISGTSILKDVNYCVIAFEEVQKGIRDYLEIVRHNCPRLFFISDRELTKLITQKKFEDQSFVPKIFPSVRRLTFEKNSIFTSLVSQQGEPVHLVEGVKPKELKTLENVLNRIEDQIIATLKIRIADCYRVFKKSNIREILEIYPQQVLHLMSQISWTYHIENALKLQHNIKLLLFNKHLHSSISEKCHIVKGTDISNLERIKLKNLLLNDLNNEYLLTDILKKGVISDTHFEWIIQFRYYYEESVCKIKLWQHSLNYGFEYQGNSSPIVLTPNTERCFRTLLNAYFFHYNGLVSGLPETGRSKTIRSLADALGFLLLCFNCTQYTNCHSLIQLLKGNILSGSWLCLENFHLLKNEIFSIISQEMLSIVEAKKEKYKTVMLDDCYININFTSFVCATTDVKVTNNLPENLKLLFRRYNLYCPDIKIIAEAQLRSQGFDKSSILARKIGCLFETLPELFWFQKQYSFSMTILFHVLKECEYHKIENPDQNEYEIVCKSIFDIYHHAMLEDDRLHFENVLKNIFHESVRLTVDKPGENILRDVIKNIYNKTSILANDITVEKAIDMYMSLKHNKKAVVILGDSFSGKSSIINVCKEAFSQLDNDNVECNVVNPKCVSHTELFGKITSEKNMEGTDGILPNFLKENYVDNAKKWLIFDAHIDCSWTNSLNRIFESRTLFFESGEQLPINQSDSFIFEATDLGNTDPTLVSHCHVIFLPTEALNWKSITTAWKKKHRDSEWLKEHLEQLILLINWLVPPSLDFIERSSKVCNLNANSIVKNFLKNFKFIFDEAVSKTNKKDEDPKNVPSWVHASLVQASVWCFGGLLDFPGRQKFDEFFKRLLRGQDSDFPFPNGFEKLEVGLPQESLLFDYSYLYKQRGTWKLWVDLLKNEKIVESSYMSEFLVPTTDTLRCGYFLDLSIKNKDSFLIMGPGGVGKSIILKDSFVNKNPELKFDKALIHFRHNTSSQKMQSLILSKLNKKKSGYYASSKGKALLCYLDDMHLSKRDEYSISSAMELLRMYFDYKYWYGLKTYKKIHFDQCQFIGALEFENTRITSGRLLRHFNVFVLNNLTCDVILKIYTQGLFYSWKKAGFPSDVLTLTTQIANATVNIYNDLLESFKPSPHKCHYVFDLKSFSKVIKGCSLLKKETYDANKKIYLKLWIHEMLRVFGDRLEIGDLKRLHESLKISIDKQFLENFAEVFDISDSTDFNPLTKLFFGMFSEKIQSYHRCYEEINFQQLSEICLSALSHYNETNRYKLDLVLFDYALEKLARIGRVISVPCENALLLGSTGCGRQTLVKLASFVYRHEFFQPEITKNYDKTHWDLDIKQVLLKCGAMNKSLVMLITEEQLIDEDFLDNVDYLLRDGEMTDLYTMEEKQRILELSRLAAQGGNRNLDISSHCVFLYFNRRCKENLHLFLSLNPGDKLRQRLVKYPSIGLSNNVMLWKDWPDFALKSVANTIVKNINIDQEVREKNIAAAVYFHRDSQKISNLRDFVTPKNFLHFIKLFLELLLAKQNTIMKKKMRFLLGLQKLSDAESQILKMQKALAEYQPQLEVMTKNAVEMTEQIALETLEVEKASALVRKDEKIAGEQALIAQTLKSECEAELAQAIPILEDAISALNTLKPTDITLVKSMKNPPDAIKLVMASVCVIKDVRPDRIPDPSTGRKTIDYWGPSKRILGDMNFLQTLKDFDKDHIKPEIMVKIRKEYLSHKDFKPHIVAKASSAAEGLCKWIIAMDMYDKVAKEVAPKKEKLNKAEREYAQTMAILNQKKGEVVRIEEKLAALNALLNEAVRKQQKLQKEVDLCNRKLSSAQKLIGSLSGEKKRWTEAAANLQNHFNVLSGDLLLSSGVIAYLAPLSTKIRSKTIQDWFNYVKINQIPCTDQFDISQVLSNDVEIDLWNENGLPQDTMFLENAIILKHSKYFCLFMDPQSQANLWIEKTEGHINLSVTKFNHSDYLAKLKNCILIGRAILIKDVKKCIPPCLRYLVYSQTFKEDDAIYVRVNGEDLKMHAHFRLYITCNQREPEFSLELRSRVNIINFALTKKAMQENLLAMTVEIEQPEIKRLTLLFIKRNKENKSELRNLDNKILNTLCESQVDILEDQEAIQILDKSKELTKIVEERQKDIAGFVENITKFKKGYINVAHQVADLFFCVEQLSRLNHVYEFSLEWFRNTYFSSILNAGKSKSFETRCKFLQTTFIKDLFMNINRALFEKDKHIFNFWLAVNVAISRKQVSFSKLLTFLEVEDGFFNNDESYEKIEKPLWIEKKTWLGLNTLYRFENLKSVIRRFTEDEKFWTLSLESWGEINLVEINHFDKLMLTKILKPHYMFLEVNRFTKFVLGTEMFSLINFNMQEIYNESYSLSPILFFSTPGEDILKIVRSFANAKNNLHKFRHLSLGENRSLRADKLIKEGQNEGYWLLIQNCHLSLEWLHKLDQNLANMDFENTHENFRLFLTTDSNFRFPLELLQTCIKVVPEQSDTLKKALTIYFNKNPLAVDDFFYGCPGKQETFTRLCYRLCSAHFVLQKRQSISNWNIQYNFEEPDLLVSLQHLQNFVNEGYSCLMNKIIYFIGECNYGGLLQNDRDKNFVVEILINFLDGRLTQKGNFIFTNSKPFGFPIKSDRSDYLKHISNLPETDNPEMFFLTETEYLISGIQDADSFLSKTRKLTEQTAKSNIIIADFKLLTLIDDILQDLPQIIMKTEGISRIIYKESCLYNKLLYEIRNTILRLKDALDGTCQLTSDLERMGREILQNQIPQIWTKFMYATMMNLNAFLKDLRQKVFFFQNFSTNNTHFWLSAFYFPNALLCSTKSSFAAENNVSLENVTFEYKFLNDSCENFFPGSLIVQKLYLKCAKFDKAKQCLVDLPEKVLFDGLPPILFKPTIINEEERQEEFKYDVACPIFKIESWRNTKFMFGVSNFITSIKLKSEQKASYWNKKGIRIVCEVDLE